jgi:hypothetical protein
MIQNQKYNISNQLLTNETLKLYITKFWNEVFKLLLEKGEVIHLMILCKVSLNVEEDSISYKTIGPLRRVEYKDMDLFINYLTERLGLIIESYNPQSVNEIVFTYITKKVKLILQIEYYYKI